jgi:hypothetical protein
VHTWSAHRWQWAKIPFQRAFDGLWWPTITHCPGPGRARDGRASISRLLPTKTKTKTDKLQRFWSTQRISLRVKCFWLRKPTGSWRSVFISSVLHSDIGPQSHVTVFWWEPKSVFCEFTAGNEICRHRHWWKLLIITFFPVIVLLRENESVAQRSLINGTDRGSLARQGLQHTASPPYILRKSVYASSACWSTVQLKETRAPGDHCQLTTINHISQTPQNCKRFQSVNFEWFCSQVWLSFWRGEPNHDSSRRAQRSGSDPPCALQRQKQVARP